MTMALCGGRAWRRAVICGGMAGIGWAYSTVFLGGGRAWRRVVICGGMTGIG